MRFERHGRVAIVSLAVVLAQLIGFSAAWSIELTNPPTGSLSFRRGDTNVDGTVDLSDGTTTLRFLFPGGDAPECLDAADADENGEIELTDASFTFSFLFLGGSPPPQPSLECGVDSTSDPLNCFAYEACPQRQAAKKSFTDLDLNLNSGGVLDVELPVISEFDLSVTAGQTIEIETTNRTNGSDPSSIWWPSSPT
jgi:hypothetical protein